MLAASVTCTVLVRAEVEFMLLAEVIVQLYTPFSTPSTATLVMLVSESVMEILLLQLSQRRVKDRPPV